MSTIHKRETIVRQANLEWIKFYMEWVEKHELTDGELLGIFAREIASILNGQ